MEIGNVQRCPNKQISVEILQSVYMLIANVLLLNLLIALFSSTYGKIETKAVQHYKFGRYELGLVYHIQYTIYFIYTGMR